MDILFPRNDRELVDFKESALKMGFEELTVECTASLDMLQPNDRLAVLIMGWRRIGDYLTKNQYVSIVANVVNWIGRHTLELWFGRDWISCPADNKTTLIEFMMKVYPTAYISMCPYSWPYMFSIYRDPWMVDYLNANFQNMNDPDLSDRLEAKDSEFIQQEGLFLIFLRIVNMFDFNMMKLVKHMCRRLLLAWHDASSSAHRTLRATLNAAESIEYVRHMYLMTVYETDGLQALHYVLECVQRNMHCNAYDCGNLDKAAQIITVGLLECKQTLLEFLFAFVTKPHEQEFSNTFSDVIEKYKTFLMEYLIRKIHTRTAADNVNLLGLEDGVYETLVKMFIRNRESSEDLMRTTADVSERLFARVHDLRALKFVYEQIQGLTRVEWYTTKVTLLLGIITEELNILEDCKYTEGRAAEDLIEKEQDLAVYYRDLSRLLGRTPSLEQEAWLTTFSLNPCKEYLEAVTKCGSRNLRVIKKQAIRLKVLLETKPPKVPETGSEQMECTSFKSVKEDSVLPPEADVASFVDVTPSEASCSIVEDPNAKKSVAGASKRLPTKKTATKAKTTSKSTEDKGVEGVTTPLPKKPPSTDVRDKDTAEVMFAASAGAGESVSMQTVDNIKYPDFALINSVTDTEDVIRYTNYDSDVLAQFRELTRILSNIRLQHSNYDDLLALLIAPRYKRLTWATCWKNLRKRCRILLTKDNKKKQLVEQYLADANERLTHLQIDYEKFRNKPQLDYGSIEHGYECYDDETDDESGFTAAVAGLKRVAELIQSSKKSVQPNVSETIQQSWPLPTAPSAPNFGTLQNSLASPPTSIQSATYVSPAAYTIETSPCFGNSFEEVSSMQTQIQISEMNQLSPSAKFILNIQYPPAPAATSNLPVNTRFEAPVGQVLPTLQTSLNGNSVPCVDAAGNQQMQILPIATIEPMKMNTQTHTLVRTYSFPSAQLASRAQTLTLQTGSTPCQAVQETSFMGEPLIGQNASTLQVSASLQGTSKVPAAASTTQLPQKTCGDQILQTAPARQNLQAQQSAQVQKTVQAQQSIQAQHCAHIPPSYQAVQSDQARTGDQPQQTAQAPSSAETIQSAQTRQPGQALQSPQIPSNIHPFKNAQENSSGQTSPEDKMFSNLETEKVPSESFFPKQPLKTYSRQRSANCEKGLRLNVEIKREKWGMEIISIPPPKTMLNQVKLPSDEFKMSTSAVKSDEERSDLLKTSPSECASDPVTPQNKQIPQKGTLQSKETAYQWGSISYLGVVEDSLDHSSESQHQHASTDSQSNRERLLSTHPIRNVPSPFITITPLPNTQAQQPNSPSKQSNSNPARSVNTFNDSVRQSYTSSQGADAVQCPPSKELCPSVLPHPYRCQQQAISSIQNHDNAVSVTPIEVAPCAAQQDRQESPISKAHESIASTSRDTSQKFDDQSNSSISSSEIILFSDNVSDPDRAEQTFPHNLPSNSEITSSSSESQSSSSVQSGSRLTSESASVQSDTSEQISKQIPFVDLRADTGFAQGPSTSTDSTPSVPQSHMYTYFPPELNTVQIVKPSGTTRINKMRVEIGQGIRRKIPNERRDLLRLTAANTFPNPRWRPIYSSIFKRKLIFVPTETELKMILSEYKGQRQNGRIPTYLNISGLTEDHPDDEILDESVIINLTNPKYESEGDNHSDMEPDEMRTCKTKQVNQSRPEVEGQEAGVKYKFQTRPSVHFFLGIPTPAYHLSLFCPYNGEAQTSRSNETIDILTIEPHLMYKMFLFLKDDDFAWEKFSLIRFHSAQNDFDDEEEDEEDEENVGDGPKAVTSNAPATERNVTPIPNKSACPENKIIQIEISSDSDESSENSVGTPQWRATQDGKRNEEETPPPEQERKFKSVLGTERNPVTASCSTESQKRNEEARRNPIAQAPDEKSRPNQAPAKQLTLSDAASHGRKSRKRRSDDMGSAQVKAIRMRKLVVRVERCPKHVMMAKVNPVCRKDSGSDLEISLRRSGRYAQKVYGAGSRANRRTLLSSKQQQTTNADKNLATRSDMIFDSLFRKGNTYDAE